jgi:hypothetical protein
LFYGCGLGVQNDAPDDEFFEEAWFIGREGLREIVAQKLRREEGPADVGGVAEEMGPGYIY